MPAILARFNPTPQQAEFLTVLDHLAEQYLESQADLDENPDLDDFQAWLEENVPSLASIFEVSGMGGVKLKDQAPTSAEVAWSPEQETQWQALYRIFSTDPQGLDDSEEKGFLFLDSQRARAGLPNVADSILAQLGLISLAPDQMLALPASLTSREA